jgi:hypothetical protein
MKKTLILLLALLLLVCAGCRADHDRPADSDTAKAYFLRLSLDPWGDWMAEENTGIRLDQPVEELAKALVEAMKSPKNTVYRRCSALSTVCAARNTVLPLRSATDMRVCWRSMRSSDPLWKASLLTTYGSKYNILHGARFPVA